MMMEVAEKKILQRLFFSEMLSCTCLCYVKGVDRGQELDVICFALKFKFAAERAAAFRPGIKSLMKRKWSAAR